MSNVTPPRRRVILLGSTGSIGTQAIDVISRHEAMFDVVGLAAGGSSVELLLEQAHRFRPVTVAVHDNNAGRQVRAELARTLPECEVLVGDDAASTLAGRPADVVLNGMTGAVGLGPTLAALSAGTTLALANKESLVMGGHLVMDAMVRPDQIVPVDSEHSAMAQALRAGQRSEVSRFILTASGGPFRGKKRDDLVHVTATEALNHPTWSMGPVVTVNSSTLVNKALELIEAHLLFHVPVDDIEVVVHPQSVIHSMIEFRDGSVIAQASPPDMRLPIALGLSWPDRIESGASACSWSSPTQWSFEPVDTHTFPAIDIARRAVKSSMWHPAVFNAANEELVDAFLSEQIPYLSIVDTLVSVLDACDEVVASGEFADSLDGIVRADQWARGWVHNMVLTPHRETIPAEEG